MKKLNLLTGCIIVISLLSCSTDNNSNTPVEPIFIPKLLKKITTNDGYWNRYFYNDKEQVELITQTSNQITLDSTYFFYENNIQRLCKEFMFPLQVS